MSLLIENYFFPWPFLTCVHILDLHTKLKSHFGSWFLHFLSFHNFLFISSFLSLFFIFLSQSLTVVLEIEDNTLGVKSRKSKLTFLFYSGPVKWQLLQYAFSMPRLHILFCSHVYMLSKSPAHQDFLSQKWGRIWNDHLAIYWTPYTNYLILEKGGSNSLWV